MGGVLSGIGKGIATSCIGKLLQLRGFTVTAIKIDPYINVDAGTMNPTEHGEVFVTEDGDETDQDIGNYERFLDTNIYRDNYMTTGRVYLSVIERERNLGYKGKCVEVVPHIPEEVIMRIKKAGKKARADFVIVEIGGTVGEYQNILFLEAARLMHYRNPEDVLFILLSYLPIPKNLGEMKTKPTQYAVSQVNAAGIQPDYILARAELSLDKPRKDKLSVFCNVKKDHIISAPDVKNIFDVPVNFEKEKLSEKILKDFNVKPRLNKFSYWKKQIQKYQRLKKVVRIAVVGKYFATGNFILSDSYISVISAIKEACSSSGVIAHLDWIDSDVYEKNQQMLKEIQKYDGIIVPGGFGKRGVEGKIQAIRYVRENNIPFLGLCYGMQLATIEFARNVCGLKDANSTEINSNTKDPVIHIMPEQQKFLEKKQYGNSMRLGAWPCALDKSSKSYQAYKTRKIYERHRHRYEFNNSYREKLEKKGLLFAGISPDKRFVEIIEIPKHPFFVATQFHPEFKSRILNPHPLFLAFAQASKKRSEKASGR